MIACIQSFLEADFWKGLGVIFTAILTTLIIWQSFRISRQQRKLQKDIHKENEDLQTNLAGNNVAFQKRLFDDNAKITLYKYRTDCYLSIIEAADLFFEFGVKVPISLLQGGNAQIELLKDFSRIKSLLLRATHEARILFSEEIHECYQEHLSLSIKLYNLWFSISLDTQTMKKLKEEIQCHIGSDLQNIEIGIVQLIELINSNDKIKAVMDSFPSIKDFLETWNKLNELFHSNRVDTLVECYIDVKNLGNRMH